ncbi:MAG: hypothetical protein IKK65_02785 [Clostridia bacterium]|nr:hypothetical protein [Clostridia bacterium]
MFDYKVKIGLIPMRRNTTDRPRGASWNWHSPQEREKEIVAYIKDNFSGDNVEFVDTKGLGIGNLIFDSASAKQAIERMKNENVDAVVIINCNFGNEEAAGDIALALGKPVLLWAPLDEEYSEDGTRTTDSQCGIFGVSRQLQRLRIPFSNIPSCRVDSEDFEKGFTQFIRVACMVKNFKGMRIGQVGTRPAPFFSVIYNESELLEKFGIRVITINFAVVEQRMKQTAENCKEEIAEFIEYFKSNFKMDEQTPGYVEGMATMAVMYKNLFHEFELDIMAAECWTATPIMFEGLAPCAVFGALNDLGYMISCESDIHCAMTMALLKAATLGKGKPIFGEFTVRHPEKKNAELLWHCGQFPLSQKAEDCEAKLVNQREWFRGKYGTYTAVRIDQEYGNYMMLPLLCNTTDGPKTSGTYIWAEFDNLPAVENRLMQGPYIHHFIEIEGNYMDELQEFCKFVPEIKVDKTI